MVSRETLTKQTVGRRPILVECLASWSAPEDWLYLYYPTRKYLSAGLRAVIEALRV